MKTSALSRAHRVEDCDLYLNTDSFSVFNHSKGFLMKTLKPELNTKYEKIEHTDFERYQK